MNTISAYVFRQALGPLLAILGALAAIAILTQGLNQLDIIITNRRAGFAFAWVTILALPQLISLILPMAVFIAVVYALNRMHSESEIAVLYGAGVSRQRLARPILQLAVLAAIVHLIINLIVQPWSFEERRKVFYDLRTDIASSLVEEGSLPPRSRRLWRVDFALPISNDPQRRFEVRFSSVDRSRVFWNEPRDVQAGRERTAPTSLFTWP